MTTRRSFLAGAAVAASISTTQTLAAVESPPKKPLYKLGIVTYNVAAKWDLPTILKVCQSVGLAAVECRTTHAHKVEPNLTADERKKVKDQFGASGVTFWGCGSVCEFHAPDQAVVRRHIEDCKSFVQLVADIGGKGVKVRPNGLPKDVPVEKTLEQIGKSLIECGKAASDAGVEIFVEVHGAEIAKPHYMKTIMEQCGHKSVGLCWNSNATDLINGSVAEAFKMLQPWLKSCHINDLYNDANGKYPYRELFRLLTDSGYDRVTLVEVGRTPPDVASGEDMLKYYKALWTELTRN